MDWKEIQPVNPKGKQSWMFIGRIDAEAPILWPPDAQKWLTGKDPYAAKTEGRRRRLDGIIDSKDMNLSKLREMAKDRQGCSSRGHKGLAKT